MEDHYSVYIASNDSWVSILMPNDASWLTLTAGTSVLKLGPVVLRSVCKRSYNGIYFVCGYHYDTRIYLIWKDADLIIATINGDGADGNRLVIPSIEDSTSTLNELLRLVPVDCATESPRIHLLRRVRELIGLLPSDYM